MSNLISNINIIVSVSNNNCIGINNSLPWDLPTDLDRFKKLTENGIVIMGRKTWESLPKKNRPLPNRENIVITRNKDYKAEGAIIRNDLITALNEFSLGVNDIWIIGGSEIYKESFQYANKLYLTRIMKDIKCDTYLEGLIESEWVMIEVEGPYKENGIDYRFDVYKKK